LSEGEGDERWSGPRTAQCLSRTQEATKLARHALGEAVGALADGPLADQWQHRVLEAIGEGAAAVRRLL
jgi:hypothetical protein